MSTSFDKEYEWQNIKPDEATKNPINNRYFSEDSVRLTLSSWKLPGWGKTRMAKLMLLTSEWSNCLSILEWLIKIHQWCSLDGLKSLNCLWELCVTVSGFIQSFYHKYWRVRLEVLTFQDCESNSAPDLGKLRKKFFSLRNFLLPNSPGIGSFNFFGEHTPKRTLGRVSILHLNFPQYQRDDCYCKLNIEERIIPASTLLGLL